MTLPGKGKKVATRIYLVDKNRLVRAATTISARNHVAKDLITSELASQETIFELATKGVKIEDATVIAPEQESLPMDGSAAGVVGDGSSAPANVCHGQRIEGLPEFTAGAVSEIEG